MGDFLYNTFQYESHCNHRGRERWYGTTQDFINDPLVNVIRIADENPNAPGMKLARKLHIPTTTDFHKLLKLKRLNTLINVTGSPEVEHEIKQKNPPGVAVIGGLEAKFMWQLIEAKIKSKDELHKHLIEYQYLVRLYLRDARHAVTDERTRIAMDLHDGLVQTLVGLNYKMDMLEQMTDNDPIGKSKFQFEIIDATTEGCQGIVSFSKGYLCSLQQAANMVFVKKLMMGP